MSVVSVAVGAHLLLLFEHGRPLFLDPEMGELVILEQATVRDTRSVRRRSPSTAGSDALVLFVADESLLSWSSPSAAASSSSSAAILLLPLALKLRSLLLLLLLLLSCRDGCRERVLTVEDRPDRAGLRLRCAVAIVLRSTGGEVSALVYGCTYGRMC